MHKQTGAILLVAGTCIGSGMIALPMVLARLGLLPSLLLMLLIWGIMYYTSLVSLELNLQAGKGLSLGGLGRHFSGPVAEWFGSISLQVLSYALLAVFIHGGSSVLQKLLGTSLSLPFIATGYASVVWLLLLLPMRWVDYLNRFLFVGLLGVVAILIVGLASMIQWHDLPWVSAGYKDIKTWRTVIPVVFTSFGFQVIFHTLTHYCDKNSVMLKKAFFWGSLIPAVVYILWTSSVLMAVHHQSPAFYDQMMQGQIAVGDLIKELSRIARWPAVQRLVWWISFLAIITSVLGVGIGLLGTLKNKLMNYFPHKGAHGLSGLLAVLPAYGIAILVPNAFIAVLGFAGMILAVIAILLPIYLMSQIKGISFYYQELNQPFKLTLSVCFGFLVVICEAANMLFH